MKLLVLNHKMNILYSELEEYINTLRDNLKIDNVDFVVCPSDIYLTEFLKRGFCVGGQDVSCYSSGSYTGEVSAKQLKSIGISHCIVGHYERRKYFKEDDYSINRKVNLLLDNLICPILCVGETLEEKENNLSKKVIMEQVARAIDGVSKSKLSDIIIAYEPIWSIGNGIIPDKDYIIDIVSLIKDSIKKISGINVKVLYGGSVDDNNINIIKSIDILDGYLLGNISLDIKRLSNLTNNL